MGFILGHRIWLAALVLVVMAYTVGRWQQYRRDEVEHKADLVEVMQQAQAEYERKVTAQSEIAHDAIKKAELARVDARAARASAERLRQRIAELASGHPHTAPIGASTSDPIGVLADVLERADRRAGVLAEYADSARIAGHACERAYDALTSQSGSK